MVATPNNAPVWQRQQHWVGFYALLLLGSACDDPAVDRGPRAKAASKGAAATKVPAERFVVGDRIYVVPSAHIQSVRHEPPEFLRIKHPEVRFELVYDKRLDGTSIDLAVPQIFSLTDGEAPNIEYRRTVDPAVICRRAPAPVGGCGTKLRHGGAEWSVLFPYALVDEAGQMTAAAIDLLRDYES